ncbi:hypothetical protein ACP4OV_015305 [Aristida adscensionis]
MEPTKHGGDSSSSSSSKHAADRGKSPAAPPASDVDGSPTQQPADLDADWAWFDEVQNLTLSECHTRLDNASSPLLQSSIAPRLRQPPIGTPSKAPIASPSKPSATLLQPDATAPSSLLQSSMAPWTRQLPIGTPSKAPIAPPSKPSATLLQPDAGVPTHADDLQNAQQACPEGPQFSDQPRLLPWPGQLGAHLLRAPTQPQGVIMFAGSPMEALYLLREGVEEWRLSVLATIRRGVYGAMVDQEWHLVFLDLLHACEGRDGDGLHGIVQAACSDVNSLMQVARNEYGMISLEGLIGALAPLPHANLYRQLIGRLVLDGSLMTQRNGEKLLRHISKVSPRRFSDLVKYAMNNFDNLMSSEFGYMSLAECSVNARGMDLVFLVGNTIVSRITPEFLTDGPSNPFLQIVIPRCGERLKLRIVDRVLQEDLVRLSLHRRGNHVAHACLYHPRPLHRMLQFFRTLSEDQLAELVSCCFSKFVLRDLLKFAKRHQHSFEHALAFARRTLGMPEEVLNQEHAAWLVDAIRTIFRDQLPLLETEACFL